MRFFKRNADEKLMTCPSCCQLVSAQALECDLCGADLREIPEERREQAVSARELAGSRSPYSR
jgi:hypothetical protein